jgi:hypothetical protein
MHFRNNIIKLSLTIFLITSFNLSAAEVQWINALKPEGTGPEEIVLSGYSIHPDQQNSKKSDSAKLRWVTAKYKIVLPVNSTTQEEKAAYELSRWLEEITGTQFVIIKDSQEKTGKEINIGNTNRFIKTNLDYKDQDLKDEGYAIAVKDGDLYLWGGKKRGPIYAVFALLEEDLGCRWFPKNVNVIPNEPELKFRPVPRIFIPKLEGREPFYYSSLDPVWSLRNRTNSPQVPIPQEWGGYMYWPIRTHSFKMLVPPEKYFKDHPEYYGLHGSKRVQDRLCLTNPDIVPIITENLRKILKESPGARAVMISKEDGGWSECECEKCTAFNKAHGYEKNILGKAVPGGGSATHLALVNAVAENLEKEFPDVLICTYAYTYTMLPPTDIKARKNVGIRLCNSIMHVMPFTSVADSPEYQQIHKGWQRVTNNIFIYDYWANYHSQSVPNPNIEMIAKNIRWWVDKNVLEISGLGTATWNKNGDRDSMRSWIFAKLLWNPNWDLKQLEQDFCMSYYGKAGSIMLQYNNLIQNNFDKYKNDPNVEKPEGGRNFSMNIDFYSKEFIQEASSLLKEAQSLAENPMIRDEIENSRKAILDIPLKAAEQQKKKEKDTLEAGK